MASARRAVSVGALSLFLVVGPARAQTPDAVQLLKDLGARQLSKASAATSKVLSSPHAFGRMFVTRAILTAKRLNQQQHMDLLAAIVTDVETPQPQGIQAAAALALGEMGRITKAELLPHYPMPPPGCSGDVCSQDVTAAAEAIAEESGGCGGRPAPGEPPPPSGPGTSSWLTEAARAAIAAGLDASYPKLVRQACITASGIASIGEAIPALATILVDPSGDALTVLLAARALSRLTQTNQVTQAIREKAAAQVRQLGPASAH